MAYHHERLTIDFHNCSHQEHNPLFRQRRNDEESSGHPFPRIWPMRSTYQNFPCSMEILNARDLEKWVSMEFQPLYSVIHRHFSIIFKFHRHCHYNYQTDVLPFSNRQIYPYQRALIQLKVRRESILASLSVEC